MCLKKSDSGHGLFGFFEAFRIRMRTSFAWLTRDLFFVFLFLLWIFKPAMSRIRVMDLMSISHFLSLVLPCLVVAVFVDVKYLRLRWKAFCLSVLFLFLMFAMGWGRYDYMFLSTYALYLTFFLMLLGFDVLSVCNAGNRQDYWAAWTLVIFILAVGIVQSFWPKELRSFMTAFVPLFSVKATGPRAGSIFINYLICGSAASLCAVYALCMLRVFRGRFFLQFMHFLLMFAGVAATVLSTGRTGLLALGIGFLVFAFGFSWKKSILLLILTVLFSGVLWWGLEMNNSFSTYKIRQVTRRTSDLFKDTTQKNVFKKVNLLFSHRPGIWLQGFNAFIQKPWTGIGIGRAKNVFAGDRVQHGHFHNTFFNILYESGIFNFTLFLILMVLLYRSTMMTKTLPVFWALMIILFFDHYFDKSLPWSCFCAWILSLCLASFEVDNKNTEFFSYISKSKNHIQNNSVQCAHGAT
jgi:O-antigen ligase